MRGTTTTKKRTPYIPPFGGRVPLIKPFDEKGLLEIVRYDPQHEQVRRLSIAIAKSFTRYAQYGCFNENGELINPYAENDRTIGSVLTETSGAISRDMTPGFFNRPTVRQRPERQLIPDMSFLDWMDSITMTDVVEEMDEWDIDFQWVKMKEKGQVKYAAPIETSETIRNEEFGTGINLKWTWLETNKFGIKLARLAPRAKFHYFDDISTEVYASLVSKITATISQTQNIIVDVITAINTLRRMTNWNDRPIYETAGVRIIAPPEFAMYLEQAIRLNENNLSTLRMIYDVPITYSFKLSASAPGTVYVILDGFEKNVFATRVPLTANGPQDDIDTFSRKMTWRGAHGFNIDATSGIKLEFDPTDPDFTVGGPIAMKVMA